MKALLFAILLGTGCIPGAGTGASFPDATGASASEPTDNTSPQVVIPATGGPPVVGIPVGGNLYIPATGGPPIVGIPTS